MRVFLPSMSSQGWKAISNLVESVKQTMSSFQYNSLSIFHWAKVYLIWNTIEHMRVKSGDGPQAWRAQCLPWITRGGKGLMVTGWMHFWGYFLKTLFLKMISGRELLWGGGTGDFIHLEEKLTLAPVIQWCLTFPRMTQCVMNLPCLRTVSLNGTVRRGNFVVVDICLFAWFALYWF